MIKLCEQGSMCIGFAGVYDLTSTKKPTPRYLTKSRIVLAIYRGKSVEQL